MVIIDLGTEDFGELNWSTSLSVLALGPYNDNNINTDRHFLFLLNPFLGSGPQNGCFHYNIKHIFSYDHIIITIFLYTMCR